MPLTLVARRSWTSTRNRQELCFPPAHCRYTTPPDRLLSEPLIAAEEELAFPSEWNKPTARKTPNHGPGLLPIEGKDYIHSLLAIQAMDPSTATSPAWMARFQGAAAHGPCMLDSPNRSCDALTIVNVIDGSPSDTVSASSEISRYGPDLPPLASQTFKEELYIRGYLKRPARRPANVTLCEPRNIITFMRRSVFPKVLGRRQGRKVAEHLRAEQEAAASPDGANALNHPSTIASVTPRTPYTADLEPPGMDTNTSASESFDLHEFSYITAFTTPPSSPSIILDAETFRKGGCLSDSKHAV